MAPIAMVFGAILIILGVVGYVATDRISVTALIPAGFGLALLLLGVLARKENLRKHAMHLAAALGLVGFLGSASGLPKLMTLLAGGEVERPAAAISQSLMAVTCAVFVGLCVKSFIDARRARKRASAGTGDDALPPG